MIIQKAQEFINPDGSYKRSIRLTDLRNLTYVLIKSITGWRRSQIYGMYVFLSFNYNYGEKSQENVFWISCFGGKSNAHLWSVLIKIKEMSFPWDPYRIIFLWRMYVLHMAHERKIAAVKVWAQEYQTKRELREDFPLWITTHSSKWIPDFRTKITSKKKTFYTLAARKAQNKNQKKGFTCKRLRLASLLFRTKDFLEILRKKYNWPRRFYAYTLKQMTISKWAQMKVDMSRILDIYRMTSVPCLSYYYIYPIELSFELPSDLNPASYCLTNLIWIPVATQWWWVRQTLRPGPVFSNPPGIKWQQARLRSIERHENHQGSEGVNLHPIQEFQNARTPSAPPKEDPAPRKSAAWKKKNRPQKHPEACLRTSRTKRIFLIVQSAQAAVNFVPPTRFKLQKL